MRLRHVAVPTLVLLVSLGGRGDAFARWARLAVQWRSFAAPPGTPLLLRVSATSRRSDVDQLLNTGPTAAQTRHAIADALADALLTVTAGCDVTTARPHRPMPVGVAQTWI
jgi:hypothetical protein